MTSPQPTITDTEEPSPPAAPEPDAAVDPYAEALRAVHEELARGNERAVARERVIERLHDENQVLKAGERQSLLRPVITDLYRLRDDLIKQAGALPADFGAERAADLLLSYAQTVELALERAGVLPLRPEPGDRFDAGAHRADGVVAAASPEADATVAEILRDGYRDTVTGRVLTPATVRVARWAD